MKNLLYLIFALFSSTILANSSRVGDSISYKSSSFEITMAYTSFDGSYMVQNTKFYSQGQLLSDTSESIDQESIITMENAGLMVAFCSSIGGVQEYLSLPVGRTLTCRVEANSVDSTIYNRYKDVFVGASTVWLGPFPVTGIAQMKVDGATFEVVNYHWN